MSSHKDLFLLKACKIYGMTFIETTQYKKNTLECWAYLSHIAFKEKFFGDFKRSCVKNNVC